MVEFTLASVSFSKLAHAYYTEKIIMEKKYFLKRIMDILKSNYGYP